MNAHKKLLKISVVICTYNRSSKVTGTLEAVLNQSLESKYYEVIVVDDHSSDDTPQILQTYKDKVRLILNDSNKGVSCSRNLAVNMSGSNIIAFTDHDCIVDHHWLETILITYEADRNQNISGLGGEIVPLFTNRWLLKYYELHSPLTHLPFKTSTSTSLALRLRDYLGNIIQPTPQFIDGEPLASIVGANMACRREVFDAVNGFDENIRHASEDEDLWTRIRRKFPNLVLRYKAEMIVKHDYDSSFKDVSRRSYLYGSGRARLYLKGQDFIPAVYPFPVFVTLLLVLSIFKVALFPIVFLSVLLLYIGWVRIAIRRRQPMVIIYSYVQLILELIMTIGFIRSYLTLRQQYNQENIKPEN